MKSIAIILMICWCGGLSVFAQMPLKKPYTVSKHYFGMDYTLKTPDDLAANSSSGDNIGQVGIHNNHVWVDLGLSVKWADRNIGASAMEEEGDYYAWGETLPKTCYDPTDAQTYNHRFRDIKGKIKYDVAQNFWKGKWRMPTEAEMLELISNCEWRFEELNGHPGYRVIGKNGQSIFLPFAGSVKGKKKEKVQVQGEYWTSSPSNKNNRQSFSLLLSRNSHAFEWANRYLGKSIRPVTP